MPPAVKLAVEIGPLAIFFGGNAYRGIFFATAAFMVAMAVALAVSYGIERRIPTLPLVTAVVVGVFGGLTLWLQDEVFIKLKPTIVNALFGLVLLGGMAFGKNYLRTVLGSAMALDERGWHKLAWRWGFFFPGHGGAQRGGLAQRLDRHLGFLQGLRTIAFDLRLRPGPGAPDAASRPA